MTERRSMAAERDATERYVAAFLADRVGATFAGRISGVTRFGLFVKLKDTAADGLAPISTLGPQHWTHDEAAHALVGDMSGGRYLLGQEVEVRLEDAAPVSGGLVFQMLTDPLPPAPGWARSNRGRGGRPGPRSAARPNPRPTRPPRRGKP
jgi:ribonuclease R